MSLNTECVTVFSMWLASILIGVSPSHVLAQSVRDAVPVPSEGIFSDSDFMIQASFGHVFRQALKPADGSVVAVVAGKKVAFRGKEGSVMVDMTPYLLEDLSLAADGKAHEWICHYGAEGYFELKNEVGQGLELLGNEGLLAQQWQIRDGFVVTATAPYLYLMVDESDHVVLKSKDDLGDKNLVPVLFLPTALPADSAWDDRGVKTLKGGWNAERLADISWNDVLALDLTHVSLPMFARPFRNQPEQNNQFIYLSDKSVEHCPSSWLNVVVCQDGSLNTLKDVVKLNDRISLSVDRKIRIGEGQVRYERKVHNDGGWETLCLPFQTRVPQKFEAERWTGCVDENGFLMFEPTNEIGANEPVIIRSLYGGLDNFVDFRVDSQDGFLTACESSNSLFRGTYLPIEKTEGADAYYFLNSKGTSFVRAAKGSALSPFRAYVYNWEKICDMQIRHLDDVTGIDNSKIQHLYGEGYKCYSLDGKLVTSKLTRLEWQSLPNGVYIINGKKHLK